VKSAAKKRNASRLASRKILAFHRLHRNPAPGVKINDACRAILGLLKGEHPRGNLKLAALAEIAKHEGSLPVRAVSKSKATAPSISRKQDFYESWEWATLRMKALKANGGRCECCGCTAKDKTVGGDPVRLHVDHIKPISKFWELRLDLKNLQVLCAECNRGKGAWDSTDWRPCPAPPQQQDRAQRGAQRARTP
jgi:5-methylcytosine-specific restriction endonuclease McrA